MELEPALEKPELTLGENCNDKEASIKTKRRSRENTIMEKRKMHKKRRKTSDLRWRWELHKRKEALAEEIFSKSRYLQRNQNFNVLLVDINPEMLYNPVIGGAAKEVYLARGCFGIVCLKLYRGLQVAVKRFLPRSLISDIKNEAMILGSLCHPYLP